MNEVTEKKKWFERVKMPHTYVILITILVIMTVLTHIIPAGQYQRVEDPVSGKMIVVPGSFEFADIKAPGFFDIFLSLQRGYVDAANIMFLIIFAYGFVYMLVKNGTMDAALGTLVRLVGKKVQLMIPITMIVLGALSSTLGIFEEVYGLFPVFVGISVALGYDIVVGGAIVCLGVIIGYASGTFNPYTIGIAQDVAGVEMFSGLGLRVVILVVFELAAILYIMNYARKVKADPTKSIMYGVESEFVQRKSLDELTGAKMNTRQKICLLIFFATLGSLLYGTTQLGWYIDEIAAMFLMMMIITGVVGGYGTTKICKTFIKSTQSMVSSMLVVGFTRGILLTMQDAMISDTIVYYLSQLLNGHSQYFSAAGMLAIQNVINFFITGSSSQATITMPIMTPVADIVGVSRQTAVLAYHFGDGFSNMFWPTACALECGLMGVPINKWYKFMTPLFCIMMVLQVVFILISVVVYA